MQKLTKRDILEISFIRIFIHDFSYQLHIQWGYLLNQIPLWNKNKKTKKKIFQGTSNGTRQIGLMEKTRHKKNLVKLSLFYQTERDCLTKTNPYVAIHHLKAFPLKLACVALYLSLHLPSLLPCGGSLCVSEPACVWVGPPVCLPTVSTLVRFTCHSHVSAAYIAEWIAYHYLSHISVNIHFTVSLLL